MIVTRFALPVRSPMPLIVPCTCVAPASTATSVFATAQPESLWVWIPSARLGQRLAHRLDRPLDARRQRAAVGVAEDHPLGARLGRGAQCLDRVAPSRARSRRRSARRRRARACPARTRNATDSAMIARFSCGSTRTTFSTWSVELLPTSVHTGAKQSARTRRPSSASALVPRRRVIPNATTSEPSGRCSASSAKSSRSFGFDAGKPGLDQRHAERVQPLAPRAPSPAP